MAHFAAESLKLKKMAILRDVKNDYSVGLANFFTETFKKLGGQILAVAHAAHAHTVPGGAVRGAAAGSGRRHARTACRSRSFIVEPL